MLAMNARRKDLLPYILGLPGVKVDDVDDYKQTALMIDCSQTYDGKITTQLLDAGANVNYRFESYSLISNHYVFRTRKQLTISIAVVS